MTLITRFLVALVAALLLGTVATPEAAAVDKRCYEMRIYHTAPGKLDALHQRFRNHTLRLFERHGIESIGYWVPLENNDDTRLVFLLAYPSKQAREDSWKKFMADPDWQAAQKASEANGPLVARVENYFLNATDYSPRIKAGSAKAPRVFELRDYTASPGNLGRLNARFRDHTVKLFAKHGMTNFGYWNLMGGQSGSDTRLLYLLAHASTEAAKASFKAFGDDPKWKEAHAASEKDAGGPLTAQGGVKSTFLVPTDYSPTR